MMGFKLTASRLWSYTTFHWNHISHNKIAVRSGFLQMFRQPNRRHVFLHLFFATTLQREGTPEGELCHSLLNGVWQSGLQFDCNLSRLVLGATTKKAQNEKRSLVTCHELDVVAMLMTQSPVAFFLHPVQICKQRHIPYLSHNRISWVVRSLKGNMTFFH